MHCLLLDNEFYDVTDWKIFYADEDYVYIITSKCILPQNLPPNSGMQSSNSSGINTGFYFPSIPATTISNISKINSSIILQKYFTLITNKNNTDNSSKCASKLLDPDIWNLFVNDIIAEEAIGGPTAELFMASWNEKYPSSRLNVVCNGSYVTSLQNPSNGNTIYNADNCYYTGVQTERFYTIATPYNNGSLIRIDNEPLCTRSLNSNSDQTGLRPVVRLKRTATLVKSLGDVWT